jgi:hypothetical protein
MATHLVAVGDGGWVDGREVRREGRREDDDTGYMVWSAVARETCAISMLGTGDLDQTRGGCVHHGRVQSRLECQSRATTTSSPRHSGERCSHH